MPAAQIPLQLSPRRRDRLEDFVTGFNPPVVDALRGALSQPGAFVYVHGPAGSGKTHLLGATCLAAREQGLSASYLALKHLPDDAVGSLEGLEHWDLTCIDDLHLALGRREWEEALFHCFNRVREAGGRLVWSGRSPAAALDATLADLSSRLAWGVQMQLVPLGDDDKLEVLARRAAERGIELTDEVRRYLIRRSPRGLGQLTRTLERVEEEAFRQKRRITVPLVREVLAGQ